MTFGQQPQNNGQYNPQYNTPDNNAAQQSGYGQQYAQSGYGQNYYAQPQGAPTYQYVPQGTGAGAATINTTMTYNYAEARRDSETKVYGEMTIGILVTAEVAVLGNENPFASVCGEIDSGAEFYDYDPNYISVCAHRYIPARISEQSAEQVRELAVRVYWAMGCRGLSRVDFFVKADGEVVFNESNTIPGFTTAQYRS